MQSEGGNQILQDAQSGAGEVPLFLILGDRGESIKLAPKSNYNECHNAKEERLVIVSLGTPNTARTLRRSRGEAKCWNCFLHRRRTSLIECHESALSLCLVALLLPHQQQLTGRQCSWAQQMLPLHSLHRESACATEGVPERPTQGFPGG